MLCFFKVSIPIRHHISSPCAPYLCVCVLLCVCALIKARRSGPVAGITLALLKGFRERVKEHPLNMGPKGPHG